MKYLSFDLETIPQNIENFTESQKKLLNMKKGSSADPIEKICSLDPFLGRILCIGLYYKDEYQEHTEALSGDEKEMLEQFWNTITQLPNGTKLVSFNGINFDIPWIRIRSLAHGIVLPKCQIDFFNTNQFKNPPHVDLMLEIKHNNYLKNISVGLGLACEVFGIPTPKEGGVDGSKVYSMYLDGKVDEVISYVKRDIKSTGLLYEKMINLGYIK